MTALDQSSATWRNMDSHSQWRVRIKPPPSQLGHPILLKSATGIWYNITRRLWTELVTFWLSKDPRILHLWHVHGCLRFVFSLHAIGYRWYSFLCSGVILANLPVFSVSCIGARQACVHKVWQRHKTRTTGDALYAAQVCGCSFSISVLTQAWSLLPRFVCSSCISTAVHFHWERDAVSWIWMYEICMQDAFVLLNGMTLTDTFLYVLRYL